MDGRRPQLRPKFPHSVIASEDTACTEDELNIQPQVLLNVIAPLSKRPIETVISKANELSAALRKTERVLMSGEEEREMNAKSISSSYL